MRKRNTWSRGLDKKYETEGHAAHDAAARLTTGDYIEIEHTPKIPAIAGYELLYDRLLLRARNRKSFYGGKSPGSFSYR